MKAARGILIRIRVHLAAQLRSAFLPEQLCVGPAHVIGIDVGRVAGDAETEALERDLANGRRQSSRSGGVLCILEARAFERRTKRDKIRSDELDFSHWQGIEPRRKARHSRLTERLAFGSIDRAVDLAAA